MKSVLGSVFSVFTVTATLAVLPVACVESAHAQQEARSVPTEPVSVSDVVNRIDAYGRMSPENAELVLGSVDASNGSAMRLELALLLVYGPRSVQDRPRGLRVLEGLVRDHDPSLIPEQTVRMIEVLMLHLREVVGLEAELDTALIRLELERQARRAADEKLDALRQIEQELEAIKEKNSSGEDDGQNQQD